MKTPKCFIVSDKYHSLKIEWKNVKVNRLTILDFPGYIFRADSNTSVIPAAQVKCDCGKEFITSFYRVKNGNTRSCGCVNSNWKGGDFGSCNDLMSRYKHSATKRNLSWKLTYEDFYKLIKQKCHYCGIEAKQVRTCENCRESCVYNGIDRKDSSKGYELDNCLPCCSICNRGKMDMKYEDYLEYLTRFIYSPHLKNWTKTVNPETGIPC